MLIIVCTECRDADVTSTVTPGPGISTVMYCPPFYDENGQLHDHDRNTTTVTYQCSRGHSFTRSHGNSCWCGWTSEK